MDTFVRKGHEGVRFFVGPEIEQTPAFGKKTLFVVGLQDITEVERLAKEHKCPHIFLSANRSFDSLELVDGVYKVGDTLARDWEVQIHKLLDLGFMVSIDYPAHKHVDMLKIIGPAIWQSRNFVPVLSVAIPKVNTSSVNLTVKIDDSNFRATNPGVWCMNHMEVTDSNRFTDWNEYGNDQILADEDVKSVISPKVVVAPAAVTNKSEVTAPALVEESVVKNNADLGLDTDSKSLLKPEPNEEEKFNKIQDISTNQEIATAYSDTTASTDNDARGSGVSLSNATKVPDESNAKKKITTKKVTV